MGLPAWAALDSFVAPAANWNLWGFDRDSIVQGDTRTLDWQAVVPAESSPVQSAAVAIGAPDGVGVCATAADLNFNAGATSRGLRAYRFVASSNGVATASVVMRRVVGGATVPLAILASDGTTVLASTLCTVGASDALYTTTYVVTEGVEYVVALGLNWTGIGGSAQARAYASKVRVNVTNGYGVFAQSFNRHDAGPAGFTWGDDGVNVAVDRAWSHGTTMLEMVFDVVTNALATEWVDFVGAADDGVSSIGLFVGTAPNAPATLRRRYHSGAAINTLKIARGAAGRSPTRISARGPQLAPVRALYLPASASNVVAPLPTQRLLLYGNSIGAAYMTYGGANQFPIGFSAGVSWTALLKRDFPGAVFVEAIGGRQFAGDGYTSSGGVLSMAGSDPALRAALIARFVAMGITRVLVEMGTNDWGAGKSALDFGVADAAFLDDIHAALPGCVIDRLTMFPRTGEGTPNGGGATLPNYDTQIVSNAAARPWVRSVINVHNALVGTNGGSADGTHFDSLANVAFYATIKAGMGL